jgi:hypothetical protein
VSQKDVGTNHYGAAVIIALALLLPANIYLAYSPTFLPTVVPKTRFRIAFASSLISQVQGASTR